jgi:predicted metalloprotease
MHFESLKVRAVATLASVASVLAAAALLAPASAQAAALPPPPVRVTNFDDIVDSQHQLLDQYWGFYLKKKLTSPGVSWINEAGGTATGCGNLDASEALDEAAFYCRYDKVMYLDITYLRYNDQRWGAEGVIATMAHEYGHHVQNVTSSITTQASRYREQQADCMAGAYLAWLATDPGYAATFDRALLADRYYALGDPPGTSPTDPNAHGSGAERQRAFFYGWDHSASAGGMTCVGRTNFS